MTRKSPASRRNATATWKRANQPPSQKIAQAAPGGSIDRPAAEPHPPQGLDLSDKASFTETLSPAAEANPPPGFDLPDAASFAETLPRVADSNPPPGLGLSGAALLTVTAPPVEAETSRNPVILIEIDPAVSGGYVNNRFDVM